MTADYPLAPHARLRCFCVPGTVLTRKSHNSFMAATRQARWYPVRLGGFFAGAETPTLLRAVEEPAEALKTLLGSERQVVARVRK